MGGGGGGASKGVLGLMYIKRVFFGPSFWSLGRAAICFRASGMRMGGGEGFGVKPEAR